MSIKTLVNSKVHVQPKVYTNIQTKSDENIVDYRPQNKEVT